MVDKEKWERDERFNTVLSNMTAEERKKLAKAIQKLHETFNKIEE